MIDFEDFEKIINVDISKLKPHPKNSTLLPQLTGGEIRRLKNRIKNYGFNEPIEINKQGYVLDGNNRIFKVLIPFQDELEIFKVPTKVININESEESAYIISKNFDRRQLSKLTQSYIRGKEYNTKKKKQGRQLNKEDKMSSLKKTYDMLAEKYNVSNRTVQRDGSFAKICDELKNITSDEFIFNLLNSEIKANKSLIIELSKQSILIIKEIYNYYNNSVDLELPPLKDILERIEKEKKNNRKKEYEQKTIKIKYEYNKLLSELAKKEKKNENELINEIIGKYLENN